VVAVTANIHGDECTGTGAVLRLISGLEAMLIRGTVHLYPSLNPEGFERRLRRVPEDDQDLNRLFPGDAAGGPGERLAFAAWSDLEARRPDVLIDLHADAPGAIPYALLDRAISRKGEARASLEALAESYAEATGLTVLREYPDDRYIRYRLDRSLTGAALNRLQIPAVTIEAGPRLILDESSVGAMVHAVGGVLHALGMVGEPASAHPTRVLGGPWRRDSGPRASTVGALVPRTRPGELLRRGQAVAEVRSLAGACLEEILAETDGFVVSAAERTHIVAGVPVCTWAQSDRPRTDRI
jgi:predicted deacylase